MKSESGNFTHGRAMDADDFRAQATGIGNTTCASRMSGEARLARVLPDIAHPDAVPVDEGFKPESAESPEFEAEEQRKLAKISRNPSDGHGFFRGG